MVFLGLVILDSSNDDFSDNFSVGGRAGFLVFDSPDDDLKMVFLSLVVLDSCNDDFNDNFSLEGASRLCNL